MLSDSAVYSFDSVILTVLVFPSWAPFILIYPPWMATCYAQAEHLTHDWMFPCRRSGYHTTLWTEDLSTIIEHLKKYAHDSRFVVFYCGCSNVPLIVFHIAGICHQGLNSLIWCLPDVNRCCNIDVFIYDGYGTSDSDKCDYDTRLTPCFYWF